jgi:predicted DCC family thiol-disulfide oxidoreductase YuxK/uncharacterized membrane protein YphA (DoxX/SURF4 family)
MKLLVAELTSPYVASPLPARVFRVGVGVISFYTQWTLIPYVFDLYSTRYGIVQGGTIGRLTYLPTIQDLVAWLSPFVPERASLPLLFVTNMTATLAMTLGLWPRASAIVTWVLTSLFFFAGHAQAYGVDFFRQTYLFFLVQVACATRQRRGLAPLPAPPLAVYRWLQFFLCIVYCTSGLSKAFPDVFVDRAILSNRQWFDGSAIYRALLRPDLGRYDFSWLPHWIACTICWGTLFLEIGFPLFVAIKRTRRAAALAVCAMHMGIAVTMGLWTFSATMITAVTVAYLLPAKRLNRTSERLVFYDGRCVVCHRVIAWFSAMRGGFVPIRQLPSRRLYTHSPLEFDLHREMYVVDHNKCCSGAAAFLSLLGDSCGVPLAWLGRWSTVRHAYQWFAKYRARFGCAAACERHCRSITD